VKEEIMPTGNRENELKIGLIRSVLSCEGEATRRAVEMALQEGMNPQEILDQGLLVGIEQVGYEFGAGNLFLPELVGASMAMQAGLDLLKQHWKHMESERKVLGKVLLGTVKGDVHSIGKDIVSSFLAAAGFEVIDLGVDVSEKTFIEQVKAVKPHVLGLSALLTTTLPQQGYVIDSLKTVGIRESVKVMVGGAPTSEAWAEKIGADGWAPNAGLAVEYCKKLIHS
jgi:corrinoid protein of di/trimethylamine methyltransferase